MWKKEFETRVLLTVTTGRVLTRPNGDDDNGISELYKVLGWMTGEPPFTHQLPRFGEECKPWLLKWFPELKAANGRLDELDALVRLKSGKGQEIVAIEKWLDSLGLPKSYLVPKIPKESHQSKDPVEELVEKMGQ